MAKKSNKIDPKFRIICDLLKGAVNDGVSLHTIAKRSNSSYGMLYSWLNGSQKTCRLDKAQSVLRAIDKEMMIGD
jgi:hypothetical protein